MHDILFGGGVISRHTYDIYDTLRRLYFNLTILYETLRTQHEMILRWSQHDRSCAMESLLWFKLCGMVMLIRRCVAAATVAAAAVAPAPRKRTSLHFAPAAGPPIKRPSPAAGSSARIHDSLREILGSVAETPSKHRLRHRHYDGQCTRCTWYKQGERWKQTCGLLPVEHRAPTRRQSWVQERPLHLGGTWALGCVVCNLAVNLLEGRPKSNKNKQRLKTKWSMYQICVDMQAERMREHARGALHKRSLRALQ